MTHFVGAVVLPSRHTDLTLAEVALESALAPFSENLEVPAHIAQTRDDLIAETREYRRDQVTSLDDDVLIAMLRAEGTPLDDDGNLLSTYNPDAQWDYWELGGAWADTYQHFQGEPVADLRQRIDTAIQDLELTGQLTSALPLPAHLITPNPYDPNGYDWVSLIDDDMPGGSATTAAQAECNALRWFSDRLAALSSPGFVYYVDFHI